VESEQQHHDHQTNGGQALHQLTSFPNALSFMRGAVPRLRGNPAHQ
jgi:hypothetical protein